MTAAASAAAPALNGGQHVNEPPGRNFLGLTRLQKQSASALEASDGLSHSLAHSPTHTNGTHRGEKAKEGKRERERKRKRRSRLWSRARSFAARGKRCVFSFLDVYLKHWPLAAAAAAAASSLRAIISKPTPLTDRPFEWTKVNRKRNILVPGTLTSFLIRRPLKWNKKANSFQQLNSPGTHSSFSQLVCVCVCLLVTRTQHHFIFLPKCVCMCLSFYPSIFKVALSFHIVDQHTFLSRLLVSGLLPYVLFGGSSVGCTQQWQWGRHRFSWRLGKLVLLQQCCLFTCHHRHQHQNQLKYFHHHHHHQSSIISIWPASAVATAAATPQKHSKEHTHTHTHCWAHKIEAK